MRFSKSIVPGFVLALVVAIAPGCSDGEVGVLSDDASTDGLRSADTIARQWVWCVEHLGSQWTIEKVLISPDTHEAVIEWTHWKRKSATAQRGDEWYVFDPASGLIREIRAYYAAPAVRDTAALPQVRGTYMGELVGFDYAGRGYHIDAP